MLIVTIFVFIGRIKAVSKWVRLLVLSVLVGAFIFLSGCEESVTAKELIVKNDSSDAPITFVEIDQVVGTRRLRANLLPDGETIVQGGGVKSFYIAPSSNIPTGTELILEYQSTDGVTYSVSFYFTYDYLVNNKNEAVTATFTIDADASVRLNVEGSNAGIIV